MNPRREDRFEKWLMANPWRQWGIPFLAFFAAAVLRAYARPNVDWSHWWILLPTLAIGTAILLGSFIGIWLLAVKAFSFISRRAAENGQPQLGVIFGFGAMAIIVVSFGVFTSRLGSILRWLFGILHRSPA